MKYSKTSSLKQFVRTIESRIPLHVRIVAEIRLLWEDVVGENMVLRSQPAKCEFVPVTDAHGKPTGQYRRRLVIWVSDDGVQTALTSFAADYLERIPKRFQIHSLRFRLLTYKDIVPIEKKIRPQKPVLLISEQDKQEIREKVDAIDSWDKQTKQSVFDFLCLCKNSRYKDSHL